MSALLTLLLWSRTPPEKAHERKKNPAFVWLESLSSEDCKGLFRERLGSATVRMLDEMQRKRAEGLVQGKRYMFLNVNLETNTFTAMAAEQKIRIFPFPFKRPASWDERAEAGDLANGMWDASDEKMISSFLVFASKRNEEIDAYTLSDRLASSCNSLFWTLIRASRGGFLSGPPGFDLEMGMSMEWFARRSSSSLATVLAHIVELKIWKGFYSKFPPKGPRYRAPAKKKEHGIEAQQRLIVNEEFERVLKLWRADKQVCGMPIGRADLSDLVEHVQHLSWKKLNQIFCGNLKDPIVKYCSERLEDRQYPILLPAPYLEPCLNDWMSRRLKVLNSTEKRDEPQQIRLLAALAEAVASGADVLLKNLRNDSDLNSFVLSLFTLRLGDSFSVKRLALLAGRKLEESFAKRLSKVISSMVDDGGEKKKKAKVAKKPKKASRSNSKHRSGVVEEDGTGAGMAVPISPVSTERIRSKSFGNDSKKNVRSGSSLHRSGTIQSVSGPQTTATSPVKDRAVKSKRQSNTGGSNNNSSREKFHRRKSEESLSAFVIKEPPSFKAASKSTEASSASSPRDSEEDDVFIPKPPPPRDPIPPSSRVRSGSNDSPRLVATASPFKLRSRTTDYMWRRENVDGSSARGSEKLQSHLSSALDLQPSAKTLVLTKEIYTVVKRMEAQVAAQRPYRETAITKIRDIVAGIWPQAHVEVFGSYATDLCLPSSDIDIVVVGAPSPIIGETTPGQQPLGILTKEFITNHSRWFTKVQAIPTARIPIIKLIYKSRNDALGTLGDIPVDITFTSEANKIHSGVAARELVRQLVLDYRELKPLAFILKQFLFQKGLSNLFSGGISSYCLVLMISTFLGAYGLDARDKNVGALLLDFLELFGRKFDFSRTGISMSSGSFFELNPQFAGRVPLWIDDPFNPGLNIGLNSFAMYRVKASFDLAFQTLNAPYSYTSVRSYLGRILTESGPRGVSPRRVAANLNSNSNNSNVSPVSAREANALMRRSQENLAGEEFWVGNEEMEQPEMTAGRGAEELEFHRKKVRSVSISPQRDEDAILFRQGQESKTSSSSLPAASSSSDSSLSSSMEIMGGEYATVSPNDLREQLAHHNEREHALEANLMQEKSKNETLQQEMMCKNDTISNLQRKIDVQQEEMEHMRSMLASMGKKK